jgi:glycine/D-amino acid oxidase-like deaminating enzyme
MAPRTIVVGAGVLGLTVAEHLAAKGGEVLLLDRGEPGSGTSRTSFAWLNSNSKVPPSYQRLNVAGVRAFQGLIGQPHTDAWLHLNGRIEWGVGAEETTAIARAAETMRAQDYPVEQITPAAARRMEPDLRVPDEAGVWLWPSEGYVIPELYLDWLQDRARSYGVRIAAGREVVGFDLGDGVVHGIILDDGQSLQADRIVICVGRWTEGLLAPIGVHVPMEPAVKGGPAMGHLGYSTLVPTRLSRTISTPRISVRPDTPTGRYVLQGHALDRLAEPGGDPDPGGEISREILALARSVLAGFDDAWLAELRVGHRAVPVDRVTVAGWAPGVDGLYVLATHSGYTLSRHLGELVTTEVADGDEQPTLADFRPSRFEIQPVAASNATRMIH